MVSMAIKIIGHVDYITEDNNAKYGEYWAEIDETSHMLLYFGIVSVILP